MADEIKGYDPEYMDSLYRRQYGDTSQPEPIGSVFQRIKVAHLESARINLKSRFMAAAITGITESCPNWNPEAICDKAEAIADEALRRVLG